LFFASCQPRSQQLFCAIFSVPGLASGFIIYKMNKKNYIRRLIFYLLWCILNADNFQYFNKGKKYEAYT